MRRSKLVALCFAAALVGPGDPAKAFADDAANAADGAGAAQAVGQAILAKPGNAEKVLSLQDDPNVKAILSDPEVMRAVRSGDLGALLRDGRIEALMRHPTVRSLADDVQR